VKGSNISEIFLESNGKYYVGRDRGDKKKWKILEAEKTDNMICQECILVKVDTARRLHNKQ
jgi:hypothetical protein